MKKTANLIILVSLFSVGYGNAHAAYLVFSSPFSCSVKFTQTMESPSGTKFMTHTENFIGMLLLFVGKAGPVRNENGNFIEVYDDEGKLRVGFDQLTGIMTNNINSKTDRVQMIGTGVFFPPDLSEETGIAYLNVKGTVKKSSSGDVMSIGISGELGGGFDLLYIFSCRFGTTLKKGD